MGIQSGKVASNLLVLSLDVEWAGILPGFKHLTCSLINHKAFDERQ